MTADSHTVSRLIAVLLVLMTGVMAGAQLGKIAPLIPWYQNEIGLSLVASGLLAATLGLFIAAVALPAGWVIDRIGLARSILAGSIMLATGAAALAMLHTPSTIFAARLIEAVGYLALCIALPAVLNAISPLHWKGPVLAIWSGFVPLGFAVSDLLAGVMLPVFAPPAFLLAIMLLFCLCAAGALIALQCLPVVPITATRASLIPTISRETVLLAVSFGAFVVLSVSMFTFMPVFVAGNGSHYLLSAGAVALSVPVGNIIASVLVRRRGSAFMARLAIAGFLVSAATAVPAFTSTDPLLSTASAVGLAVSSAIVASAQFAAIPFVTPAKGSVPVAIGLVSQAGGIGTVFGPPLAAAIIEQSGWTGFGWFLVVTALVGLACMLPVSAAEPRTAH